MSGMSSDPSLQTVQLHGWLERLRAGDLTARDELVRSVCGRLERLARKMLKSFPNVRRWADTDDILQSTLMRLLHTLEKVEPASTRDFFGLAAEHIRRELLDLARHFNAKRRASGKAVPLEPSDSSTSAGNEPIAQADDPDELENWCRFHEEVDKLPTEEREVVGLVFYHGWTQAEIADLFKVTERTVRRRWQSACLHLSETLGGGLPES